MGIELTGTPSGTALWLTAEDFSARVGSPVLSDDNTFGFWLLDSTTVEYVGATRPLPAEWTTFDAFVWLANAGAVAGDVSMVTQAWSAAPGATASNLQSVVTVISIPATTGEMVRSQTITGAVVPTAGDMVSWIVRRTGSDAADTLASDVRVIALEIRRAT